MKTQTMERVFEEKTTAKGKRLYLTSFKGKERREWVPLEQFKKSELSLVRTLEAILRNPSKSKPKWLLRYEEQKKMGVNVLLYGPSYTPKRFRNAPCSAGLALPTNKPVAAPPASAGLALPTNKPVAAPLATKTRKGGKNTSQLQSAPLRTSSRSKRGARQHGKPAAAAPASRWTRAATSHPAAAETQADGEAKEDADPLQPTDVTPVPAVAAAPASRWPRAATPHPAAADRKANGDANEETVPQSLIPFNAAPLPATAAAPTNNRANVPARKGQKGPTERVKSRVVRRRKTWGSDSVEISEADLATPCKIEESYDELIKRFRPYPGIRVPVRSREEELALMRLGSNPFIPFVARMAMNKTGYIPLEKLSGLPQHFFTWNPNPSNENVI